MQKGVATKDICYATQNRQDAVKKLSKSIDLLLVIGAKNSSNSNRLRDLGLESNLPSYLINNADDINEEWLKDINNIGITAGASAPEVLVQGVIDKIKKLSIDPVSIKGMGGVTENIQFILPKKVRN